LRPGDGSYTRTSVCGDAVKAGTEAAVQTIVGEITVVQEGRFRLTAVDGRSLLFVLAHGAPLEPEDLTGLLERRSPVQVHFTPAPARLAALAHDITEPPASGGEPQRRPVAEGAP